MVEAAVSLWIAPLPRRFFRVPSTTELRAGEDLLVSLEGDTRRVDLTTLAPFEVAEQEVATPFRQSLQQGLEQVRTALVDQWASLHSLAPGLEPALAMLLQRTAPSLDGPTFLGTLLGREPEEVRRSPDKAGAAMDHLFQALEAIRNTQVNTPPIVSDLSVGGYRPEEREAMQALLKAWSIPSGDSQKTDPLTLEVLRALIPRQGNPATAPGEPAFPDQILQRLQSLQRAFEVPEMDPSTRQEQYDLMARRDVEAATSSWKPPNFSFNALLEAGRKKTRSPEEA